VGEQSALVRQWILLKLLGESFHETSFGISDYSRHAEILDALMVGIEDRRVVWLTYQSQRATEPVTYDVHPYRLTRHQGSLYLLGWKAQQDELRTWRVDRMESASVDEVRFTVPADMDIDGRLAGSFGIYEGAEDITVRAKIAKPRARYVAEKAWHPSQQVTVHRDGSVTVEFRLSGTVEFKNWILSFGADAEVLEPASLREEIAAELHRTLAAYRDPAEKEPTSRVAAGK
jgi:predicted DNA-binding transcriptional regulator YafY